MPKKLAEYKKKRKFEITPEPKAKVAAKKKNEPIFVIQKHDARALHFDVRLEVSGVMPSWAVPKGPSKDPKVLRLAVKVEDHPLAYAKFKGKIPKGQYGAGTVEIWDHGTYENLREQKPDPKKRVPMKKAIKDGLVEVRLHGTKLKGSWALFRTSPAGAKEQWMMKKMVGK